jgi:hypothetical protein
MMRRYAVWDERTYRLLWGLTGEGHALRVLVVWVILIGLAIPFWRMLRNTDRVSSALALGGLLVLGIAVTLGLHHQHRLATIRRRRKAGLCSTCGYDLRASKWQCPECGAAVERRA